ncbi:MAG: glutamate--tRNA ligase [Holosporales bacterium]|jgi:glutamyl-tRNA synthetase|nr:glutamate--tRNA ligase [Holosporales bacterium]
MSVVVRFAPSPTGFLHIGGARTALFNWLYARHTGGKFLLRIEDTDRERSTQQAIDAIFESLKWLELNWDNEPVFQFSRAKLHAEVAKQLVEKGLAYYCYCSVDELTKMREESLAKGLTPRYNGYWRDRPVSEAPRNVSPVIRFKAPQNGTTIITDLVQGRIEIDNTQLDDMVLLRADGTPTYMLSVVVDDHYMEVTHVIRGDDHLTNAFRQYHLYKACQWTVPEFAHIPLIHGADGTKLSKRHGALGVEQYKDMGFLPEAIRNYLLRLGWSHGNSEIISTEQAIKWFDIHNVGRAPARFDLQKLINLNGVYIRQADNWRLLEDIRPRLEERTKKRTKMNLVLKGMNGLKERAKTLIELADHATFYLECPIFDDKNDTYTQKSADDNNNRYLAKVANMINYLQILIDLLTTFNNFDYLLIEEEIRKLCKRQELKVGDVVMPARIAITGSTVSPSLFEVMSIFGKDETISRLAAYRDFLSALS